MSSRSGETRETDKGRKMVQESFREDDISHLTYLLVVSRWIIIKELKLSLLGEGDTW